MIPCTMDGGDDDDRQADITIEASSGGFVDVTVRCCSGKLEVRFYLEAGEARTLVAALQAGAQLAETEHPH